jgi:hypothetical protein
MKKHTPVGSSLVYPIVFMSNEALPSTLKFTPCSWDAMQERRLMGDCFLYKINCGKEKLSRPFSSSLLLFPFFLSRQLSLEKGSWEKKEITVVSCDVHFMARP